ncbi:MAG: hypothetical protein PHD01_13005 [Geobacteraceae bacterium]|nr:hypothetical protein [Geobacteraceae bacterium]
MLTSSSSLKNKTFSATEEALADVSKLLSQLCKSRKAPSRLLEIINLTGAVARLTRSLQGYDVESGNGKGDGYGDPSYVAKMSKITTPNNVTR